MYDKRKMIECRGVTKVFLNFWGQPRVKALNGLDLEVVEGSVTGLLGPNGAGKSTLIKILLGHLYPTAGTVKVLGKSPRDVNSKERIGYLPERTSFYTNLTARETLAFFADLLGIEKADAEVRIDQLLRMVGLDNIGKRLVGEFSHGMRKRLGLAQSLLNDPDLLLLDEPTAGMDPIGCREIKDLILTLRERGKTILLTTHLLADVQDVSDTIIILYGGRVQASGSIEGLLSRPEEILIRCPRVPDDKIEQARRILAPAGKSEFEITHPIRTLEDYFLSVVNEAGANNAEVTGARRGDGVAEYLRGAGKKTKT